MSNIISMKRFLMLSLVVGFMFTMSSFVMSEANVALGAFVQKGRKVVQPFGAGRTMKLNHSAGKGIRDFVHHRFYGPKNL